VLYYLNRLWYIVQLRDLEEFFAVVTFYSSVGGASVEQRKVATSWALGDNLHSKSLNKAYKGTKTF